jgi:diadenosine tetraphosphate (Ap4A) HIT family hydrolase
MELADNLITRRVELARAGTNPYVIARFPSGWLVLGDVQPLHGYCVFLADPVVASINDLDEARRVQYSLDVLRAGDALLAVTDAYRINYETLGNTEPALHTHILPRYKSEPDNKRKMPAMMVYSWKDAPKFDAEKHGPLMQNIKAQLEV